MKKHRVMKTRTKRRNQKGGDLFNPLTWFSGDDWGGWFSNIGTKAKDTTSNLLNSANNALGTAATNITSGAQSAVESAEKVLNTNIPLTGNTDASTQYQPEPVQQYTPVAQPVEPVVQPVGQDMSIGGKRRRRRHTLKGLKKMKGGKGGLGLTYYATPVSNIKVAQPTYWEVYANGTNQYNIKGGSRKRRGSNRRGSTRRRK